MSFLGEGLDLSETEAFFLFEVSRNTHLNWMNKGFSKNTMLIGVADHPHYGETRYPGVDHLQLRGKMENIPEAQLEAIWYFFTEQLEEGELNHGVQFKIRDRMLNHYGNY